jgi:hypothetical protein
MPTTARLLRIDSELLNRFQKLFPYHGAFTQIVNALILRHVEETEAKIDNILKDQHDA